ncbi:SCP-like protein, partial [Cooperia oncophora]
LRDTFTLLTFFSRHTGSILGDAIVCRRKCLLFFQSHAAKTMASTWTTRLAQALQYHDGTRFTLALGESPSKDGFHPPAKNLFKMRWNCTLEKEARALTKDCPKNVSGAPENGMNLFHGNVTGTKQGKYNFLSDAVDAWLYESDRLPMGPNATFNDTRMYSFANVKLHIQNSSFYEDGLPDDLRSRLSLRTVWLNQSFSSLHLQHQSSPKRAAVRNRKLEPNYCGCAWNNTVCEFIKLPEPEKIECEDLLCMLPYRVKSRYL